MNERLTPTEVECGVPYTTRLLVADQTLTFLERGHKERLIDPVMGRLLPEYYSEGSLPPQDTDYSVHIATPADRYTAPQIARAHTILDVVLRGLVASGEVSHQDADGVREMLGMPHLANAA